MANGPSLTHIQMNALQARDDIILSSNPNKSKIIQRLDLFQVDSVGDVIRGLLFLQISL